MAIETSTTRIDLRNMEQSTRCDWRTLADTVGANLSLYPEWSEVVADSHNITDDTKLLIATRGGEIAGIFPTCVLSSRTGGLSLKSMGLVSNYVSYHNNLVTNLKPEEVIEALINEATRRSVDVIHLAGIVTGSDIDTYLTANTDDQRFRSYSIPGESSPFLPLVSSWDELLATKAKKFRYKARKRTESLEHSEALQMRWFRTKPDCSELLSAMKIVEENSWKKAAGVSIFESQHEQRYHEALLPFLSSQGSMFANVLLHGNLPIAYNLCCVSKGWVGQMKTSFDTRYSDLSPGSLVIDSAIRHAIEINATEFDFLGGTDPHKLAWTKSVRSHTNYFLYLRSSLKGTAIGWIKSLRGGNRREANE